jgi:hypothetical protein
VFTFEGAIYRLESTKAKEYETAMLGQDALETGGKKTADEKPVEME